ncbi:MAG: hypothetical protein J0L66_18355 [Cytophagales bacterium]|nr:hypothetical protein [Cytophagales bacterium]
MMKNSIPKATKQGECLVLFDFQLSTLQGAAHVFLAVDTYTGYVFMLSVEPDKRPNTVLKKIYFLLEDKKLAECLSTETGFTLVVEEYEELAAKIEQILKPVNGKLIFNKSFCQKVSNPVLKSFRDRMLRQKLH